jgi:hypothetical protein
MVGANRSKKLPRRGLGIHFVPAEAKFRDDTSYLGKLWVLVKSVDAFSCLSRFFFWFVDRRTLSQSSHTKRCVQLAPARVCVVQVSRTIACCIMCESHLTQSVAVCQAPHKQEGSLELPEYAFPATWL